MARKCNYPLGASLHYPVPKDFLNVSKIKLWKGLIEKEDLKLLANAPTDDGGGVIRTKGVL